MYYVGLKENRIKVGDGSLPSSAMLSETFIIMKEDKDRNIKMEEENRGGLRGKEGRKETKRTATPELYRTVS